jgi:purine-binding chemotaxis protein CheW
MDESALAFRADRHLVAMRLGYVTEVVRPLPVEPLAGVPPFVRGFCVLRGVATPVVDVRVLLGGEPAAAERPRRFVGTSTDRSTVALAVDEVIGIRDLPLDLLYDLPSAFAPQICESVAAVGAEPMLLLSSARVVPDSVWAVLTGVDAEPADVPGSEPMVAVP